MTLMGVDLPLEAIRRQIASGVDILVHLGRMRDKSQKSCWRSQKCADLRTERSRRVRLYRREGGQGTCKNSRTSTL